MKKHFLNFRTRQLLNKRIPKSPLSYRAAQIMGIITNEESQIKNLDALLDELKNDQKEVHILRFSSKEVAPTQGENHFCPYDFNLFGNIKSASIIDFIDRTYDYLFVLDQHPNTYMDYIVAKSKSKLNIGFFYEEGNQMADFQIKPDLGRELDDLLKYTRQLS